MEQEHTTIYRLNAVSRIANKWLRRLAICLTLPALLALNLLIAAVSTVIFVGVNSWKINRELFASCALRWNTQKTDDAV
jgi:hypothetical protein